MINSLPRQSQTMLLFVELLFFIRVQSVERGNLVFKILQFLFGFNLLSHEPQGCIGCKEYAQEKD